ncbi:hypothetical protein HFP15_07230 [Amycolatopsis sp. K13G38]|uniref:Uncharacterized protein n=1 Tax=Amycolatopsis acididurans TaxID=2724524 RepID=A0ABX1IYT9_9PSEU|nr:hypothetical protein [Amycolatopsis acididurans]NKQ52671.1 hypothetical protein [Amycolatopsis acididurans]
MTWPLAVFVPATAVLLLALAVVGRNFTRRTLRAVAAIVLLAGALVWYFRLLAPPPAWPVFAAALVLGYYVSETFAAHREPPGVDVAVPLDRDNDQTKDLLTELGFRLPAVSLHRPAAVPGGTSGDQVATIVQASEVRGGALAAALIRLAGMLIPLPRRYVVRVRAERCDYASATSTTANPWLWMTVDVRDQRGNASIAVTTFDRTRLSDAAEHAAAFVAATVLHGDPATPRWLLPVRERAEDLAKYLLGPPEPAVGAAYAAILPDRADRMARLSIVARDGAAAGIVRYELAMLEDLCGHPLAALRLHARTVAENPRFRRGQYRLGMSLVMAAGEAVRWRWLPEHRTGEHDDIVVYLRRAGMTIALPESAGQVDDFRRALLDLGQAQLREYRRALRFGDLARTSLRRRSERGSALPYLKSAAMRRQTIAVADSALLLCRARRDQLDDRLDGSVALEQARREAELLLAPAGPGRQWQYAYNLACILAMRPGDLRLVLGLLRLAADSPSNPRASEWIGRDPDLQALHGDERFLAFLRDQVRRDFPGGDGPCPAEGDWFTRGVTSGEWGGGTQPLLRGGGAHGVDHQMQ